MNLSIGIVTRNRPDSLERTLKSLSLQSIKPYEVIISDDSVDEANISLNKAIVSKYGHSYISGPVNGLYANRNFVAKNCKGTHIRSMDDDHEFPEGHIEACMTAIEKEPNTIWTIGEFVIDIKDRLMPYPIPGQLNPRGFASKAKNEDEYYGISCGATIYPRRIIDENILNVEFYKFGNVYLEYGARLKYLGYKLKVLKTTYIIHNALNTTAVELSSLTIIEPRIFAIFCFSFIYNKSIRNKVLTISEIFKLLITKKITFSLIKSSYTNYQLIQSNLIKNANN